MLSAKNQRLLVMVALGVGVSCLVIQKNGLWHLISGDTAAKGDKVKGADGNDYVLIRRAGEKDANGNQSIAIWGRADGSPGQYLASLEPLGVSPFFTLLQ
jgi:hypothetical protein